MTSPRIRVIKMWEYLEFKRKASLQQQKSVAATNKSFGKHGFPSFFFVGPFMGLRSPHLHWRVDSTSPRRLVRKFSEKECKHPIQNHQFECSMTNGLPEQKKKQKHNLTLTKTNNKTQKNPTLAVEFVRHATNAVHGGDHVSYKSQPLMAL